MDHLNYELAREKWKASEGRFLKQLQGVVSLWLFQRGEKPIDANNETRYWSFGGGWLDAQEVNEELLELELIEAPESNEHGDHDFSRTKPTAKGIYTALSGELPDE